MTNPKVTITFTDGKVINLELYPEYAPKSVENFLNLVDQKFYDGLVFHRIIDGFMIQGGGYDQSGKHIQPKTPISLKGEFLSNGFKNNTLKHTLGVISMARTMVKDSATTQFFICAASTPHLDGEYAAFGKTIDEESNKNVLEIAKVRTGYSDEPLTPVVIKSVVRM